MDWIWEARAEYADGTVIDKYFDQTNKPEDEQEYDLCCWLLEAHPDCTWYSVNVVYTD